MNEHVPFGVAPSSLGHKIQGHMEQSVPYLQCGTELEFIRVTTDKQAICHVNEK